MWPRLIPMPILMTPQWPLVVTASIFQLPSKVAAVAGETEQKTTNAVARVKAHRRLAIMGILILCCGARNGTVLATTRFLWTSKSTGNFPRKRYRIIAEIGAPRQAGSRQADRTN